MRRAAPGPQLSAGRLRVDAARAIAKLREYQLADRTAWVLEAIRAAVASGATAIELRGDANDVWLAWHAAPWPAELLPRLFDELVSPEPASERHHVRLLAAAVNSALGMDPAYVDVIAIGDAGAAIRARYTPDVLAEPAAELGESALRRLTAEPVAAPAGAAPGMLVHLRRRASLAMVSYLFWELEPPELPVARAACRDIAVPLRIGEQLLDRRDLHGDVLRLALGDGLDGFVAVVDPDAPRPPDPDAIMMVAERGVLLTSYALQLAVDRPRARVPLRLVVDAPRMPTNASRSQVRRDSHPIAAAERRARALVPQLVEQLSAATAGPAAERARAAALALLAAAVAGPDWRELIGDADPVIRPLAALPLLRDATGAPRAADHGWRRGVVHTGRAPFGDELAPWLGDVLWLPPGDPGARLLGDGVPDPRELRRRVRWARRQLRARRRFFDHAPRAPRIDSAAMTRLRCRLGAAVAPPHASCIDDRVFDGLTGELCLHPMRTGGELILLLHGREIERIAYDSLIGFSAIIDAPALTPADRFRGVVRDAAAARCETAMRAAVVRAVELIAHRHAGGALPDGCELASGATALEIAGQVRAALALARELRATVRGPLLGAPAWRALDPDAAGERWVSLAQIRASAAIGVAPHGASVRAPANRLVVHGHHDERALIGALAPGVQIVRYDMFRAARSDPQALAGKLLAAGRFALIIREPGLTAAIAPAAQPRVHLHHMGVKLDDRPFTPRLLRCAIAVDADAIVPDDGWARAADAAGLASRDHIAWETAFVRAAAAALIGERPADLVGHGSLELDGELGRALCSALAVVEPDQLLGGELAARVRAHPLIRVLGTDRPCSADAVAAAFPAAIPYVARGAIPVAGYAPVVGDALLAGGVARLVGRTCFDGGAELELHRRAALRRAMLTAHRSTSPRQLTLTAGGPQVEITLKALGGRGVVGLTARFELDVLIEDRRFCTIRRDDEPPLAAVIAIGSEHADATFERLPDPIADHLVAAVRAAAPRLLVEIARVQPHSLGDPTPAQQLLADTIAGSGRLEPRLEPQLLAALTAAPAFRTVRGGRVALDVAGQPRNALTVARWQDRWLEPGDDSPATALDDTVLALGPPDDPLPAIFGRLFAGAIHDASDEVARLQAQRRMARGLLPIPSVSVDPRWKRKLSELGEAGRKLGHGELGLVETPTTSLVLLHARGQLADRVALDVLPAIHLAIEAPELVGPAADPQRSLPLLTGQAQDLAVRLVREVVAAVPVDQLSVPLRRNLRNAVLARRLDGGELPGVPLFETITGGWLDSREVQDQIARYGSAWSVPSREAAARPLDDARQVIVLSSYDLGVARANGIAIEDASRELALDAKARRNRARPPVDALELRSREGVLAEVPLAGDGATAATGAVAVLLPAAAELRGLHSHRARHPFDVGDDPCQWPTLAIVDDARLAPDRTWSAPVRDAVWHELVARVRTASDAALALATRPPAGVAVAEPVPAALDDVLVRNKSKRRLLRGSLWLAGPPRIGPPTSIEVVHDGGTMFVPNQLGVAGLIFGYSPGHWPIGATIDELAGAMYARLVHRLIARSATGDDHAAAHAANALALKRIRGNELGAIDFRCYRPGPLQATSLAVMLLGSAPVHILGPDDPPAAAGVIDDGSLLSRVVIAALGPRGRRGPWQPPTTPRKRPPTAPPPPPSPQQQRAAPPAPPPAPPRPPHPLDALVARLRERLAELGLPDQPWRIAHCDEPIVRFTDSIELAGDNRRLHAIANAYTASSPWAPLAIDALTAQVVTVLNVAFTHITDAAEAGALGRLLDDARAD